MNGSSRAGYDRRERPTNSVAARDPDTAASLMERHVAATRDHWAREVAAERETEEVSA